MTENVGAHKLQKDFNRYLHRVRKGERLIITERGQPVAVVSPWVEDDDVYERLAAEQRVRRSSGGSLAAQPLGHALSQAGSEALLVEEPEERA